MTGTNAPAEYGSLHVDVRLRQVRAEFELDLQRPDVTVLFGPSGAGKTTIIRAIAGLERIEAGEIRAGATIWDDGGRRSAPPRRRRVGFLFQDQALFPHLDVEANVAYGLPRMPRGERARRVAEVLETCAVPGYQRRAVTELSGGEAQRVALARALAPRPRLLLLDEPLTGLDEPTRIRLRDELRSLILHARVPALVVTHDRDEALALGDRLIVLIDGRIHQIGPPGLVFDRPADTRVAAAVGMDTIAAGRIVDRSAGAIRVGDLRLRTVTPLTGLPTDLAICLRAGDIGLAPEGTRTADATVDVVPAAIRSVAEHAGLLRVRLDAGSDIRLTCLLTRHDASRLSLQVGTRVDAVIPIAAVHVAPVAAG